MRPLLASIFIGLIAPTLASAEPPADLILHNGTIVTVDDAIGTVQALAVRGDRIIDLGTNDRVMLHRGETTRIIDLDGRLAIPGFIEGHGHFTGLGEAKMNLDLMHVRNWNEVIQMVAEAVKNAQPGEWIVGRGWHQEKWDSVPADSVEGFPTHHALSAVSPDNPVFLGHASGHASFANAKAMEMAGISGSTEDPPGGEILRNDRGEPIGIFRETATALIARAMEGRSMSRRAQFERLNRAIQLASEECLKKGVTSFQDAGSDFATITALAQAAEQGELGVRLWVMIRDTNEDIRQYAAESKHYRLGNNFLTVGGIKRSIDGALGSRGAWLLASYSDAPDSTGLNTSTIESVTESARLALELDLQMCVHAIGDRANRETLDIYERLFSALAEDQARNLRWRVEHAQHLHPADIPRFGSLGVIASMQGVHCTSDGPWVYARLGEERAEEGAYVRRKLIDSGAVISNGTDAPVEDVDPISSFYSTVSRRLKDGSVFFPDQRLSRMEALKTYTINAAFAAKEEDIKGTLTPGKLADIVVLSRNILECEEDEIPATNVVMTIVGGKVVYQSDDAS